MHLDDDTCYRAIASRDRRFEGRFVVAVRTTRVYCRPGCPAPLPKRTNVCFYVCAAAAEEAGFRPCMRCRPEASPGTPAWLGTSVTVARALRLIGEGALDDAGLDALAERLGVGARHLRRLFTLHLGASPSAVAQTRRVHFARKLIDETKLPMSDVATSSGFASIRRFNDAVRRTFRAPPRALRARARVRSCADETDLITLTLAYREPYDWDAVARFLGPRAIAGVERVERAEEGGARRYARTVTIDGAAGIVEVTPVEGRACVRLRTSAALAPHLLRIVERVTRIFDLAADPLVIARHLARDGRLAPLIAARPGLRVPGAWNGFELAVRAILGQQISVLRATRLAGDLTAAYGRRVNLGEGLTHLFPTPAALASAAIDGMPRARAEAVRALATTVRDGALALDGTRSAEETRARLLAVTGIGAWTAEYVAMRALGEPDAFPASDLGLLRAYGGAITPRALEAHAETWRPWRAYAAMHLWTGG